MYYIEMKRKSNGPQITSKKYASAKERRDARSPYCGGESIPH
jgi:hypothetical protein